MIFYPNSSQTMLLTAWQVLTITAPSGSAGSVERLPRVPGGGNSQSTTVIAGADLTFGPYAKPERFNVICTAGSVTPSMAPYDPDVKTATATNDDAAAGDIGELKISTVAIADFVALTTGVPENMATLLLTPGDWDVSAVVNHVMAGATPTVMGAAISPTTGAIPAQAGGSGVGADSLVSQMATFGTTLTGNFITAIGPVRVSLAATATIYLVAADTFSAGTLGVFGTLRARRVR